MLAKLDIPFIFKRRPSPVPGDLRPTWRIALILLILLNSRSKKASLRKLHVVSWAARTSVNRELFIKYSKGEIAKDEVIPRVEPSLNRAIDLARGEGLVSIDDGKNLALSASGLKAAEEINGSDDCLVEEKAFLSEIKTFANETNITGLLSW
jgi:hypothetical protein